MTGAFARLIAPVVTTISIALSSNKVQNGDILVLANPGPSGKMDVKMATEISATMLSLSMSFCINYF